MCDEFNPSKLLEKNAILLEALTRISDIAIEKLEYCKDPKSHYGSIGEGILEGMSPIADIVVEARSKLKELYGV